MNWQPIETAPKDRTYVLLSDGAYVVGGWWNVTFEYWSSHEMIVPAPTHWMPLPEPPKV